MPRADVVVVGAGLAGLVAAARLAEAGARVQLVAKGHAGTHWGAGGLDLAALSGTVTPAEGVARLAGDDHPYRFLGAHAGPATAWLLDRLAAAGLPYAGSPDDPIRRVPTAIGGTRPVAIVPMAQAAALRPWSPDEVLVVAGPAGYKDFWPAAIAGSLRREAVWQGAPRPSTVVGVAVEIPSLLGRHNLNGPELARRFDDPDHRADMLERLARAVERAAAGRPGRVALPAVVGHQAHAEAWEEAVRRLPLEPFEVPLVPPSLPGMRLYGALRSRIRDAGGRLQVGESVARVEHARGRVTAVELEAATRTHAIRAGALVLATGGITGGGIVATADGRLVEPLLGLPVEGPDRDDWLLRDALDPRGHPVEAVGIRTDERLAPLDAASGLPAFENVLVAGGLLAGQRALRERCGDGVALASGWLAGELLAGDRQAGELPIGGRPAGELPTGGRPADAGAPARAGGSPGHARMDP